MSEAGSDAVFFVVSWDRPSFSEAAWGGAPVDSWVISPVAMTSAGASEDSVTLRLFEGGMLRVDDVISFSRRLGVQEDDGK